MSCLLEDFDYDNCCTDNESMEFDIAAMEARDRRKQEICARTDAALEELYRNAPDECDRAMALEELERRHGPRVMPANQRRPLCGDF